MRRRIERDVLSIIACDLSQFQIELSVLEKIKAYDEYTYLHSLNVAKLSVMLGERLELSKSMLVDLGWAALLHDIGKLKVPLEVLNKLKKFTPEELSIMQSHPVESLTSFSELEDIDLGKLRRLSAAFEHHQRFDLKGYPNVDKKLGLHPYSRIVAVADSFDAMTTDRIYQRRLRPDMALRIMSKGYGCVFDPTVLQAFITAMGVYPAKTVVRLSNDKLAVVLHYSEKAALDRPTVQELDPPFAVVDLSERNEDIRILHSESAEDHEEKLKSLKR
ncbi:MAG: HD domain-containing protein [Bradymonadales bacterium]|nr:MAG: HD domain-containing protein [Bradymonadales bacterium]